jgi:hypothetical protein
VKPSLKIDVIPIASPTPTAASRYSQSAPFGVTLYARACAMDACSDSDSIPGAGNFMWRATVPVTGGSLFIADTDPQYCDPQANSLCNYYVAVYPDIRCRGQCVMDFQIRVVVQDGSGLRSILYADVESRMAVVSDTLQPNAASTYELWVGGAVPPPASLFFHLETCEGSGGVPTMFVCSSTSCTNPSNPTDTANANAVTVVPTVNGVAELTVLQPASVLFIAIFAPPAPHRALRASSSSSVSTERRVADAYGDSWTYRLMVTAGARAKLSADSLDVTLSPPPAVAGKKRVGFEVTWSPLMTVAVDGARKPALGVVYTVVVIPGAFPANVTNTTACGLLQTPEAVPFTASVPKFNVEGLSATTLYSVAVVATCTMECWTLSGGNASQPYINQLVYSGAIGRTGSGAPSKNSGASKAGITALIVVLVIAGVAVAAGLVVYWRRKRSQREYQYQMYDVADADGTYSTTAGEYSSLD